MIIFIKSIIESYIEGNKCSNAMSRNCIPHIEEKYIYNNSHRVIVVFMRRINYFTIINLVNITPIGITYYNAK